MSLNTKTPSALWQRWQRSFRKQVLNRAKRMQRGRYVMSIGYWACWHLDRLAADLSNLMARHPRAVFTDAWVRLVEASCAVPREAGSPAVEEWAWWLRRVLNN